MLVRSFIDFLMPKICIGCKNTLNSKGLLCMKCLTELPESEIINYNDEVALHRFSNCHVVKGFYYWLQFQKGSVVQNIIHSLKYNNTPTSAKYLGYRFASLLRQRYPKKSYDYIIPIPIHWKTYWSRGYNQAYHIAEGFSKVGFAEQMYSPLQKVQLQKSQNKKSKSYRLGKINELFRLKSKLPYSLKGKSVIIVDDLFTTGSTLESCIKILIDTGVSKIEIAVIGKTH